MYSKLALITILDGSPEIGGGPATPPVYPSHGLPGAGYPSTGPVYPPGHPSAGLPIQPGHPGNRPPNVAPNVIWPPSFPPHAGNELPPELSGNRPTNPIQLPEGAALPPGSTLVLAYSAEKGWQHAVVSGAGTKPVEPAQPKK